MPRRTPVPRPDRVRCLRETFYGWLDVRLLREGWLRELPAEATAVYTLLCLAANRQGVSFYRRYRLGEELGLDDQQVHRALARLEELDLVAYEPFQPGAPDGYRQVLSLPVASTGPSPREMAERLARRLDPGH